MKPFANESDNLQVGDLVLENRIDRITISGDVDITRDKEGLEMARKLSTLLTSVLQKLESDPDLPEKVEVGASTVTGPNPFS